MPEQRPFGSCLRRGRVKAAYPSPSRFEVAPLLPVALQRGDNLSAFGACARTKWLSRREGWRRLRRRLVSPASWLRYGAVAWWSGDGGVRWQTGVMMMAVRREAAMAKGVNFS
ncbi:hypothetical protein DEO72_LG11g1792 [Vigna unguiculata]|uniref:Uncharacterized protein n=1 Tax=Vigna unguiculata TaxID=3917 RepID=A0A4D6NMC4_VIGUN|nr:hypothetical protein DEO72_LG11g1792 [Vigna unguiculata]